MNTYEYLDFKTDSVDAMAGFCVVGIPFILLFLHMILLLATVCTRTQKRKDSKFFDL